MENIINPEGKGRGKGFALIFWVVVLVIIVVAIAVFGGSQFWGQQVQPEQEEQLIGGDQDEHGCLIAAGYSWCEATQKCIRQWETYCTAAEPKVAVFTCDEEKTITATFYPTDDQYVDLVLSDERMISVPRAISASGARYANADETFVFWNKGDTAFITEGEVTTFANCVTTVE